MTLLRRLQGRCCAMRTVHIGVVVGINADVHGFCVHALRATAATCGELITSGALLDYIVIFS